MAFKDEARFYPILGRQLPSVTTALSVVNKAAIGPWMAKMERHAFEVAMIEVAAKYEAIQKDIPPGVLVDEVLTATAGVKAGEKARDAAANVGIAAHAMIEWLTRRQLGLEAGPEPVIPDAAMVAVESFKDWKRAVDFTPLHVEPVVYHLEHGYAGRADVIGMVCDVRTLADYKTGARVYPEAHLQLTAYRHAATSIGLPTDAGLILRLPKTLQDPAFEAVPVPDAPLDDFLHALALWRWQRRMSGQPTGG